MLQTRHRGDWVIICRSSYMFEDLYLFYDRIQGQYHEASIQAGDVPVITSRPVSHVIARQIIRTWKQGFYED